LHEEVPAASARSQYKESRTGWLRTSRRRLRVAPFLYNARTYRPRNSSRERSLRPGSLEIPKTFQSSHARYSYYRGLALVLPSIPITLGTMTHYRNSSFDFEQPRTYLLRYIWLAFSLFHSTLSQ